MSAGISAALSMARPPVPAPEGRVALVATSVEGGRSLWDRDPEATSAGLRLATALLKRLLVDHRGYEVRGDGDALLLAFSDALTACRWCLDAQEALLRAEWPSGLLDCPEAAEETDGDGTVITRGLRIGMAVHAGEPTAVRDPRTDRTEYEGGEVDWVEQVARAVHGGQIVLTAEAWAGVEEAGAHLVDADVTDLGKHRFAGREEAASLFQVLPWQLANRAFPEVETGLRLCTNLPSEPGLFVGRDRLLTAVERYFQKGRKTVVLKGQGGIGKTRLALRYAGMHVHEYGDGGVWVCDLSGARSIDGICHVVSRALGISLRSRSMQATQQLGHALAARGRCLLVLDNFEQVERYAEYTVALWTRKAPRLRLLVTSRHRLHVPGEAVVEVTPLDTDEAATLFRSRAEELRPDLEIPPDDPHLAEILERVQCVPLAVELAAAWVSMLTLEGIAARLDRGHAALEGVDIEVNHRHTSLREVMEEAWGILTPFEQEALVSCSVFRGGFTPEAAQEVIDLSHYRKAPAPFKVLKSLRDKSLVTTYESPSAPGVIRWGTYDAVREFAAEKLVSTGLKPTIERRHARVYLALARHELERIPTTEAAMALISLEAERENIRAVLDRMIGRHPQMAIQAAMALDAVMSAHGPFDEHLTVLEGAIEAGAGITGTLQIPARLAYTEALLQRGRFPEAAEAVADALSFLRPSADESFRSWANAVNGWVLVQMGRIQDGGTALRMAHEFFAGRPDHPHASVVAYRVGLLHLQSGELDEARECLDASLQVARKSGDPWLRMDVLAALGDLARQLGKPSQGKARYEEALRLAQDLGDRPRTGRLLARMGSLALDLRQGEEAATHFAAAREAADQVGDVVETALIDGNIARMAHHEGRGQEAEDGYESVIEALTEAGATRWIGVFRGVLGALFHEQGHLEQAADAYAASIQVLEACGDRRFAGLVLARLGALHADHGRTAQADVAFGRAREHLEVAKDPTGLAALEVHKGHLDLARFRAGHPPSRKKARQRFKDATTPRRDGSTLVQPPAAISNDVRLALRLLRRCMELES